MSRVKYRTSTKNYFHSNLTHKSFNYVFNDLLSISLYVCLCKLYIVKYMILVYTISLKWHIYRDFLIVKVSFFRKPAPITFIFCTLSIFNYGLIILKTVFHYEVLKWSQCRQIALLVGIFRILIFNLESISIMF